MKRGVGRLPLLEEYLGRYGSEGERTGLREKGCAALPGSSLQLSRLLLSALHVALILFQQRCLGHVVRIMAIRSPDLEIPIEKKEELPFSTSEKSIPG